MVVQGEMFAPDLYVTYKTGLHINNLLSATRVTRAHFKERETFRHCCRVRDFKI